METKKNAEIPNKMINPETGMVKVKIQDRAQIIQHSLCFPGFFFHLSAKQQVLAFAVTYLTLAKKRIQ